MGSMHGSDVSTACSCVQALESLHQLNLASFEEFKVFVCQAHAFGTLTFDASSEISNSSFTFLRYWPA